MPMDVAALNREPKTPQTPTHVPTETIVSVLPNAYRELRGQLVRAVRRVCPVWLAQDADDLVQESLIRVLQRQRRADNAVELSPAYLKKVAYSAVIDEIRRRRRRVEAGARETAPLESLADDTDQTRDAAIGEGITRCLARQNADRRRALTLYLVGNSIEGTATVLGSTTKRAENLIYRGLEQLRECLTALGFSA